MVFKENERNTPQNICKRFNKDRYGSVIPTDNRFNGGTFILIKHSVYKNWFAKEKEAFKPLFMISIYSSVSGSGTSTVIRPFFLRSLFSFQVIHC
jgi:hypothetical protein